MMAGDEELLSVDDKDIFASAMSDTPPAEPEKPVEEPKPEGEQPRDEHGRFLPKAADAETPQPEAAPAAKPEAAEPAEKQPREDAIPSWRLREVADARRRVEEENRSLQAQLQQREALIQQYLQQARQQQQPPEKLPDPFEQPAEYAQALRAQFEQERERLWQQFEQREIQRSLQRADRAYGEEFKKAYLAFDAQRGNNVLLDRVRNAFDQGDEILSWYREREALREIGPDPKAYLKTHEDKLLDDEAFKQRALERWRAKATPTKPSNVTSLPNLARAPGSSSNAGDDDWPTTEAGIFSSVTAGLNRR
ncbi:MAG: hypothetical protein ABWY82_17975 [Tardiphaga sp.]